jgi:hypothetical protein
MGVKIWMTAEVINSVAGALIAKQVLREVVRRAVKTPLDQHYFVVTMHKGVSQDLRSLSFGDLSKLLDCPTTTIHRYVVEHMLNGSAPGGCKFCNGANKGLRRLVVVEKKRNRDKRDPFSVFVTLDPKRKPAGGLEYDGLAPILVRGPMPRARASGYKGRA